MTTDHRFKTTSKGDSWNREPSTGKGKGEVKGQGEVECKSEGKNSVNEFTISAK